MSKKYRVAWDNGSDACGVFPFSYDTEEEAEKAGEEWASASNLADFGELFPAHGYSFDVIAVDVEDAPEHTASEPTGGAL